MTASRSPFSGVFSRLPLAARLALIALSGATAIWLMGLALHFSQADEASPRKWLPPERAAAIVETVERTPVEQRRLLLQALNGQTLQARLDPVGFSIPVAQDADSSLARDYLKALGDRRVALFQPPAPSRFAPLARLFHVLHKEMDLSVGLRDGAVLVLAIRAPEAITPFGLPVGLAGGLLSALVALFVLIGLTREAQPLRRLAQALDKIDLDGAPVEIPLPRRAAPEIRSLASAFARLQERLAALLRARMALIGGISHDLRTFATRLRLRVEAIPDPDERRRAISDIADMIRLLDDSLLATQAGARQLREELVDLRDIVVEEAESRRRSGAPVSLSLAEDAPVLGDPLALRRILANLVDNALKYGGRADLSLLCDRGRARLLVEDRGPGIPAPARNAAMEPFARLEPSRSRDHGGAGLGLAIARNLARAQGGDLSIADRPGGGASVALDLPRFHP